MVVRLVFVLSSFLVILMVGWILPPPSSLREFTNTSNTTGAMLIPLSVNPNVFFHRLRVLCNRQIVEDVNNSNRVCHMFDIFQSENKHTHAAIEAVGVLGPGESAVVAFTLCSGLLSQDKFISLKYAPLVFELGLVGSPGECLDTGLTAGAEDY